MTQPNNCVTFQSNSLNLAPVIKFHQAQHSNLPQTHNLPTFLAEQQNRKPSVVSQKTAAFSQLCCPQIWSVGRQNEWRSLTWTNDKRFPMLNRWTVELKNVSISPSRESLLPALQSLHSLFLCPHCCVVLCEALNRLERKTIFFLRREMCGNQALSR